MAGMDIAPIVRAQDYTFIKHNEDIKPHVDPDKGGHFLCVISNQ